MKKADKMKYWTIVPYATGVIYLVGVPILMMGLNASGWTWTPSQPEYEQMIMGVYATLGIFLILAAKDPLQRADPNAVETLSGGLQPASAASTGEPTAHRCTGSRA